MKKSFLFLNGIPPKHLNKLNVSDNFVACTDGAYDYLREYFCPDLIIGDLDSLKSDISHTNIEVIKFNSFKDKSDGLLAIEELINRGYDFIEIYGAFGGRLAHEYYNYCLLDYCNRYGALGVLRGEKSDVYLLNEKNSKILSTMQFYKNQIISVAPYSDVVHILTTKGLLYPADGLFLYKGFENGCDGFVMGLSNMAVANKLEIVINSGKALVFIEK